LLANIALHVLDQAWQGRGQRLGVLVKYADDLVILCATRAQAEEARELVAAVLDGLGLRLHPEKTRIARLARGAEGLGRAGARCRRCRRSVSPTRPPNRTCPFLSIRLSTGHAMADRCH
jgi:RNA-directed DNA polymerase